MENKDFCLAFIDHSWKDLAPVSKKRMSYVNGIAWMSCGVLVLQSCPQHKGGIQSEPNPLKSHESMQGTESQLYWDFSCV